MKKLLMVLSAAMLAFGATGCTSGDVLTFDDLDTVSRPIDPEVYDGYGGLNWAHDEGTGAGWLLAYKESEAQAQYGYNPNYPSGDYAARIDGLNHAELIVTWDGSNTFDFLGAKFHGINYTTAGGLHCWAETLDFTGTKNDGTIVQHLNQTLSHTGWSTFSFTDMTNLVELRIMGESPSHPGTAFGNSMWVMDDFNYRGDTSCRFEGLLLFFCKLCRWICGCSE